MAYVMTAKGADAPRSALVPLVKPIKGGESVTVRYAAAGDLPRAKDLLNAEIRKGDSYPYFEELDDAGFEAYFCSHDAFVAEAADGDIAGIFYIKPNFPGRSAHFCNGGFVTAPPHRGKGVGRAMGEAFLVLARDLGYRAAMFNLVYETNVASVFLWESLGFRQLALLPVRRGCFPCFLVLCVCVCV